MNLENKTILITGSTDGIGKATAIEASKLGANIIVHGRIQKRIDETLKELSKTEGKGIHFGIRADFSRLEDMSLMLQSINERTTHIDILFNNAAGFFHEKALTQDGFEQSFQVNYLAPFLLTYKLLPLIRNVEGSKLLNVSSMIHSSHIDFEDLQGEKSYSGREAYSLSKLLNILHTYKLTDILLNDKTKANCLHPGVIETKLLNATWSGGSPVSEGAENLLYAALSPVTDQTSGLYLENRRPMQSNPITYDKELQNKLWDYSLELLKEYI